MICSKCGGYGKIQTIEMATRDMAIDAGDPDLEGFPVKGPMIQCQACEGSGLVPDDEFLSELRRLGSYEHLYILTAEDLNNVIEDNQIDVEGLDAEKLFEYLQSHMTFDYEEEIKERIRMFRESYGPKAD